MTTYNPLTFEPNSHFKEQTMTGLNNLLSGMNSNKLLDRFFRRADNVVWDLMSGRLGFKTRDGIVTLDGEGDDAVPSINPLDGFSMELPAFGQQTPIDQVKLGDMILQFEADIRIVEQLTQLWLEGNGGGNGWESYDLAWLFAGLKTKTDSWDKRGKKGFLFTFGDEPPPPINHRYGKLRLEGLMGKGVIDQEYTTLELLKLAMQRWAVFHVIVEEGSHARRDLRGVTRDWMNLFGEADNAPNLISLNDYKQMGPVVTAVLQVAEGADPDEVIAEGGAAKDAIRHAFGSIER